MLKTNNNSAVTQEPGEEARQVAPRGRNLMNAIVRFGAQLVAMGAHLLATPYIIHKLGVESYGIVGVINTMIGYVAITTTSLTATVGRNMTFAIEKKEFENANKEISTAVFGLFRIFAIAFMPLCAFSIFVDQFIVIPGNLVSAARIFSFLSILSFYFMTMSGPLGAAMFVRNRLDLASGSSLARTLFFILLIVTLFSTVGANLQMYGVAMLAASILLFSLHLYMHRRLLKNIEISKKWFDRKILKGIVSLGGWMTLGQIGGLLILQTDLIIANRVLGPVQAGQLAAILVIPVQMRVLAGLFSSLFGPTQAAIVAKGDGTAFSNYLLRSIHLTSLFFALLVGVFCGSAYEILSIWLGQEFVPLLPVTIVLTAYLILSLSASPLTSAVFMLGKVKIQSIVTVLVGFIGVVSSIVLAKLFGLIGIASSQCIILLLLNAVFVPWYVSRICKMNMWTYWREQSIGVLYCIAITLTSYFVNKLLMPDSMIMLVISLSVCTILGSLILIPSGLKEIRRIRGR